MCQVNAQFLNYIQLGSLSMLLSSVVIGDDVKHIPNNLKTVENVTKHRIWARGRILYYIDGFSFDKVLRDRIRGYLAETRAQTGLQFVEMLRPPAKNWTRWVLFINRRGQLDCDDYYATKYTDVGVQRVVVGYDCAGAPGGGLAAAVLALAGVPPQHNAPDRDKHITVVHENILPDRKYLFHAIPKEKWLFHEFEYDFESAGHYDLYKYTKNGQVTIRPKNQKLRTVDKSTGLSVIDILKIRKLYNSVKSLKYRYNNTICRTLFKNNIETGKGKLSSLYNPSFRELAYLSDFMFTTSESGEIRFKYNKK